ncbi:MAG: GxxExxY protein [Bacteroidetes bacterium]|jgi:GxxExxY protein|nr:GxxExxY protein [Bacteroidota bacterium]MBP6427917.1 GxxExxY protein [Bacteroidia bacterium]MBL0031124.1 GxxExxY protein [Bacteroidota bacterium]MBP6531662.1 GxxExxY protein [Bacteroidia bacterium]MBP6656229.1 GxxExxY protein [Bacteroidia bacterium]
MTNETYKYSEETSRIIGLAMEVHREIGNGFQECIYQRALEIEFKKHCVPFKRELEMLIFYKGQRIGKRRVDFLVNDLISVELKAVSKLESYHYAQALNYLEIYKLEIGLLINFGTESLQVKRLLNKKMADPNYK